MLYVYVLYCCCTGWAQFDGYKDRQIRGYRAGLDFPLNENFVEMPEHQADLSNPLSPAPFFHFFSESNPAMVASVAVLQILSI